VAPIRETTLESARDLEERCVEAALDGALVLAGHGRLARRILHLCRMRRIAEGRTGWESPRVHAFRRWVRQAHESLWEPCRPLSAALSLRLWHEACEAEPPPEPLAPGPDLYRSLQDAHDLLEAFRIRPQPEDAGHSLPAWRARATARFRASASAEGAASWGAVAESVSEAVRAGRLDLPERILLTGFDELKPLESALIDTLSERTEVLRLEAVRASGGEAAVRTYATPEQECRAVAAEVLDTWNSGVKNIAVLFFEESYGDLLGRSFTDLAAGEPRPENAIRYNIVRGVPLGTHPLFVAATLPLRLLCEPVPHPVLVSLFDSPYSGRRPTWGEDLVERLVGPRIHFDPGSLLHSLPPSLPGVPELIGLLSERERTLSGWLDALDRVRRATGFPHFEESEARETDRIAWKHLQDIERDLRNEACHVPMGPEGALQWLAGAAAPLRVVEKTPETAGIQILGHREARGIHFDRLWVVGCHGSVLPEPSPDRPFLSPAERAQLEDSESGDSWQRGVRVLMHLGASGAETAFSRALQIDEEHPFLPCPLLRDGGESEGGGTLDLWSDPPAPWLRARWFRGALRGLRGEGPAPPPVDAVDCACPTDLTIAGGLQDLMQCPARFFFKHVIRLDEPPDPDTGLTALQRGRLVHEIVRRFGEWTMEEPCWHRDPPAAAARLAAVVRAVLAVSESGGTPRLVLEAEHDRLMGGGERSLLRKWLGLETDRARKGWRLTAAEKSFGDMPLGRTGLRIRGGKVDRIDAGPEGEHVVWDYKTGSVPSSSEVLEEWAYPQLPAYAAALEAGALGIDRREETPILGGYIQIQSLKSTRHKYLQYHRDPPVDLAARRAAWLEQVTRRLAGPLEGRYEPDPHPAKEDRGKPKACKYCPYGNLCGYFDGGGRIGEEDA